MRRILELPLAMSDNLGAFAGEIVCRGRVVCDTIRGHFTGQRETIVGQKLREPFLRNATTRG